MVRKYKCSEKSKNGDGIFGIKEAHVHLRLDLFDHFRELSTYCFVVLCRLVIESVRTVV